MADGLNKVMCLGNLAADPELRMTQGGQAVLKMRIACNESYLDKNKVRQEKVEWISAVLWGKRAESLSKFLSKGNRIFIEGALRTSSYDDKDGNKRYRTEVNATNVILCGGKGEGRSESKPASSGGGGGGYDDGDYGGGNPADDPDLPFVFIASGPLESWNRGMR